ncbi:hypothetical protein [Streptomyces sp. NPDC058398]|uniref:hypothetical protein n=1 Tax=Streptomyces sp. NPDC058398 TaxID=3346479 RepID=UPI003650651E
MPTEGQRTFVDGYWHHVAPSLISDEPDRSDDSTLDALVKLRNRLTHFGASDTAVAVEARAIPVLDLLMRFIDEELLPNETSDAAAEAWKLREAIRPLVGRVRGLVERRLGPLTEQLEAASTHTLRCLSCGHFATILAAGPDGVGSLGSCLLCGKRYDSFTDALEAHGMGSRYEAVTQGGPPPAYECSECLADEDCVVLTQTADDPARCGSACGAYTGSKASAATASGPSTSLSGPICAATATPANSPSSDRYCPASSPLSPAVQYREQDP